MATPQEAIRSRLEAFREKHRSEIELLTSGAEPLLHACRDVRQSWSGSFIGWHGRMYFRDFEKPSIHEMFNGEWGGIRGIPDGWEEKTNEDVEARIDKLMGGTFSVTAFDATTRELRSQLQSLKDDLGMHLSRFSVPKEGKAAKYISEIEETELGTPRVDYINSHLPTTLWSRDSEALRQGKILPGWLYYEAVASEAKNTLTWLSSLDDTLSRLFQIIELTGDTRANDSAAVNEYGLHPVILDKCSPLFSKGHHAEAVEKGFKIVRDRLRTLTGFERGSEAFGKGHLHIKGAAAQNVDQDFNDGAKFLMMSIDMFRNEKVHTSDAQIDDPARAYQYLILSSLAMYLLDQSEITT